MKAAGLSFLCAAVLACAPAAAAGPDAQQLINDQNSAQDVLTYGMGYDLRRHSPLARIDRKNVHRLVPVWSYSLASNLPQEGQPLIRDGVMYFTATDATVAIDALSGKQVWKTPVWLPQDVFAVACCGANNRGPAIYRDKLFRVTLDAHVVALDAKTGKELWRSKAAQYSDGYAMTGAPLIADGVLITGIAGGEYGIRGFIDGWNPDTGERLWRRYTTAAPGEPGGDTWNGDTFLTGGAPTWLTGSYDPELNLVFWGVGNGGPWNPMLRNASGPARDNLYTNSALAIRPKTGELVWHYQFSPNDPFDYDGVNELILAELPIGGKPHKIIMQANRNGFFYILERATGKLLAANPFVDKINWAARIDMKTGRPVDTELTRRVRSSLEMTEPVEIWPSALGGKNWSPMAYSPSEGLAFANTLNFGFPYRTEKAELQQGSFYLGMDLTGFTYTNGPRGYLKAIDPHTGKSKWQVAFDIPNFGGVLSTAGGLVFTGTLTGEFMAFDSAAGNKLWQFQTGSGIVGLPVTWEHNGRQYVTIASGLGGVYPLFSGDERLNAVPLGGSLWTFALYDKE